MKKYLLLILITTPFVLYGQKQNTKKNIEDVNSTIPKKPTSEIQGEVSSAPPPEPDNKNKELESEVKAIKSKNLDLQRSLDSASKQIQKLIKEKKELDQQKKDLNVKFDQLKSIAGKTVFKGWVFEPDYLGWVYTTSKIKPYMYSQKLGWFFYDPSNNKRLVYLYTSEEWVNLDD